MSPLPKYLWFVFRSVVASSVIMFASMAAGELLIDANLFSGFLQRPSSWSGIFIETSVVVLLISVAGLVVLTQFRFNSRKTFVAVSIATWIFLSAALTALYAYFYWPREWHLTILTPGLIFGWLVPGFLTLGILLLFSLELRQAPAARSTPT